MPPLDDSNGLGEALVDVIRLPFVLGMAGATAAGTGFGCPIGKAVGVSSGCFEGVGVADTAFSVLPTGDFGFGTGAEVSVPGGGISSVVTLRVLGFSCGFAGTSFAEGNFTGVTRDL